MAEMKLDGGEAKQRSMLMPVVLALVVLAALGAWFARVYLRPGVTGAVDRVEVFPVHSVYTREAGTVGADQVEDTLYVIADVALTDRSEVPLFLKDINGTFTMEDGTVMQASAIEKVDLPRLMAMFPKMKPVADAAGPAPLVRESQVPAGATGRGWVVFAYNVPQNIWEKRKAADVSFDFYHQDRVTLPLPK